jgi:hypothetical protein
VGFNFTFSLASVKLLTNSKILPVIRFRGSEAAILAMQRLQEPACMVLKYPTGSRLRHVKLRDFFLQGWTLEKIYQWQRGKQVGNHDAASGPILEVRTVSVFKEVCSNFAFSLRPGILKI